MPFTPDQEKLVILLVQEASEIIKEYTKGALFGFDEIHTDGTTAIGRLKVEFVDLVLIAARLQTDVDFINPDEGEEMSQAKLQRLLRTYPGLFDDFATNMGITRQEAPDGSN